MQIQPVTGWQDHVSAGRRYIKVAEGGQRRPGVFNNELVFQLAAMAIEKIIVGLCHYHRRLPVDHTLSGLVETLASVCPLDAELIDRIRRIEAVDDMCTLSPVLRRPPGDRETTDIVAVAQEVARLADRLLPLSCPEPSAPSPDPLSTAGEQR